MNDFVQIAQILNEIEVTSGTNAKTQILIDNFEYFPLKLIFKLAYDPYIKFNITKIDTSFNKFQSRCNEGEIYTTARFLEDLDLLVQRKMTGHDAIHWAHAIYKTLPEEFQPYLEKIFQKDLKIGVSTQTINKVWNKWIDEFFLGLCERWKKIKPERDLILPLISEPKIDAVRGLAFLDSNGAVQIKARSGLVWDNFHNIEKSMQSILYPKDIFPRGIVIDGEIQDKDFTSTMTNARRLHNVQFDNAIFRVWDILPIDEFYDKDCTMDLETRRRYLASILMTDLGPIFQNIHLIPYDIIESIDELIPSFQKWFDLGYEGAIFKNLHSKYIYSSGTKRGKSWVKFKIQDLARETGDKGAEYIVKVTGSYLGEKGTKNEHRLGGFTYTGKAEFKDVEVEINGKCGGGYKHIQRDEYWVQRDDYLGALIEVESQEVTINKKGKHSLRFPIFQRFRPDLTEVSFE